MNLSSYARGLQSGSPWWLSGWADVPAVAGGIVAIQPDTPQTGTDTVTITEGTNPRIFGRLKVAGPPAQP